MIEPTSLEEASEAMRSADGGGRDARICGAGTKVTPSDECVSTRKMTRVIDYAPADMTITVEAGVTLAEIERLTKPDNLRLAMDPPLHAGFATIGGILAANDSGPLRMTHGGPRDMVVGMTIVLGDGSVVRSGGRVVKNVAGYGIHRLMVGSAGELGMIAAATLKLQPRPESLRLGVVGVRNGREAESITARAMAGHLRPAMIEWVRPAGELGIAELAVVLGFEDCRESVEWQLQELGATEPGARMLDEDASAGCYSWLREWATDASVRAAMLSSTIANAFSDADNQIAMLAHAGSGCVLARGHDHLGLQRLTKLVRNAGGQVLVPRQESETHSILRARLKAALRMGVN